MGNHTWARKEILNVIDSGIKIIRPANYPKGVPGKGRIVIDKNGIRLAVVNLLGRIYMDNPVDCPFQTIDRELSNLKGQADITLVDFHAEATSEKVAFGYYVDGWCLVLLEPIHMFKQRMKKFWIKVQHISLTLV
jgi:calcineurin-like phosphoesterase